MEIKSVWLCYHCRSMFNTDEEMVEHLKGKKCSELDCPKCGKPLGRWTMVKSLFDELFNMRWLSQNGMVKCCKHENDEITLEDSLVEWVEKHTGEEDEWEDD